MGLDCILVFRYRPQNRLVGLKVWGIKFSSHTCDAVLLFELTKGALIR